MQAYTIPTGSMADTLRGAHFGLRCQQCGYHYDYGFLPEYYRMERNTTPGFNVPVRPRGARCPSCGYYRTSEEKVPVSKGDRIFVAKCVYQFSDPKRWDVVVFKNPVEPQINYIKRMIGLPGEKVEIIDGDVYINGEIARKPERVQGELWMCVYDNDYQPIGPERGGFNGHRWYQPFENLGDSAWDTGQCEGRVFSLDGKAGQVHTVVYNTNAGNDFRATYAYDISKIFNAMPICSDLKVSFDAAGFNSTDRIGANLSKYGVQYRGWVDMSGQMVIERVDAGDVTELVRGSFEYDQAGEYKRFEFANVDHKLIVKFGESRVEYDLGPGENDAGIRQELMPEVMIFGCGKLQLTHVGVYRDIHYIGHDIDRVISIRQGSEGVGFELDEDEFFVLGDNTPASADSRCWNQAGIGNGGVEYRQGTVPRDYLVGKAFFVYWPGPFMPLNDSGLAKALDRSKFRFLKMALNIPDIGSMKIINGGE